MKSRVVRLVLCAATILLIVMFAAVPVLAQDKDTSRVTIKSTQVSNGVVIVSAREGSKSLELQCNQNQAFCKAPDPGEYSMVRLPKNWGIYDCANVDLFPLGANPSTAQKVGEYCLTETK